MDIPSFTAWLADSPFRLLDYRWSRATWIRQAGNRHKALPGTDDEWVAHACRVLSQDAGVPTADPQQSPIHEALRLTMRQGSLTRWQLEALLLTSESFATIAEWCALPESVVEAYHNLFFCVRDRLDRCDWINWACFGPGVRTGYRVADLPLLWRVFAYEGGAKVLELVIAVSLRRPLPAWVRAPSGQNQRAFQTRLRLSVQLAIATMMMQTPAEAKLIRSLSRARKRLDQMAGGRTTATDPMVDVLLDSLAMGVPRRPSRPKKPRSRFARIMASGRQRENAARQPIRSPS